jgi:hypothetical protein
MNPLESLGAYEHFIYSLQDSYSEILRSSLVVIRRGPLAAHLIGEIEFSDEVKLVVDEQLLFLDTPGEIQHYGYEVWRRNEKLYWYDSQPHPNNPFLASTHPHHKHIPPDIKHNRIPAPGLSFKRPNIPFLISEIENVLLNIQE